MRLRILYFADIKDCCGLTGETLELDSGATMQDAWSAAKRLHPALTEMRLPVLPVLDRRLVPWSEPLVDDAELTFLTPVSGG